MRAKHAQQIRDGLQPFVAHARKTSSASTSRRRQRPATERDQTASVRSWAKDHGIQVNDRGRIPASVMKEYEASPLAIGRPAAGSFAGQLRLLRSDFACFARWPFLRPDRAQGQRTGHAPGLG